MNRARKNFEKKLAHNIKSDTKSFYAYIRSMSTSRMKPTTVKQQDGTDTVSTEQTCNEFNIYFSSVFTNETLTNISEPVPVFNGGEDEKLKSINITEEMVHRCLSKLRVDKAPGADDMMPRFLVEIADCIVEPLCNIYNNTLRDGQVPLDWKRANVSPIHKKGSRVQAENYRPISLTSQLCKVFEYIMRDVLVNHLERLHLIYESQHGFRRGRSCLSNLLTFLEKATKAMDDALCMDVFYLDLAKAFNKVPHERLIRKLTSHGIEGEVRQWLGNWLKGRQQRVCIDGYSSTWRSVVSGVPQGSVIDPILFLIYINDLDLGVKNEILKFADDTKLYGVVTDEIEAQLLQSDLNVITSWADEWQMKFNLEKCKVMHIGKKHSIQLRNEWSYVARS